MAGAGNWPGVYMHLHGALLGGDQNDLRAQAAARPMNVVVFVLKRNLWALPGQEKRHRRTPARAPNSQDTFGSRKQAGGCLSRPWRRGRAGSVRARALRESTRGSVRVWSCFGVLLITSELGRALRGSRCCQARRCRSEGASGGVSGGLNAEAF